MQPPPKHPSVEGFWKFCSLRQEAYWLRQQGLRHPDPAFRFHFCNVYREADRGTVYFADQLGQRLHGDRFEKLCDVIWFSVAYRLLNRLDTFKDFGGIPASEDLTRWLRFLRERMAGGHKIFTGRHLNIGFAKYEAALEFTVKTMLSDGVTKGLADDVRDAAKLQDVVKAMERIPGVGTFFGWQITCDLMESGRLNVVDADAWVHLGPGAWNALKLIGSSGLFLEAAEGAAMRAMVEQGVPHASWDRIGRVSDANATRCSCSLARTPRQGGYRSA